MAIYPVGRPMKYNPSTGIGHVPPQKAGEYRIRDFEGRITYIGETNNLYRRIHEHIRSGKLQIAPGHGFTFEYQVADGRSTSHTRRKHEQQKIQQHCPSGNKSKGGEGRPAR